MRHNTNACRGYDVKGDFRLRIPASAKETVVYVRRLPNGDLDAVTEDGIRFEKKPTIKVDLGRHFERPSLRLFAGIVDLS